MPIIPGRLASWLEELRHPFFREASWPGCIRLGTAEAMWRQRRVARLKKGLPRLYKALKQALARGRPPRQRQRPASAIDYLSVAHRIGVPPPPLEAAEGPVYQAVLGRLGCPRLSPDLGFGLDFVRHFQARQRGWSLPKELPGQAQTLDEVVNGVHPGQIVQAIEAWLELCPTGSQATDWPPNENC